MKIRAFIALEINPNAPLRKVIRQFNEMGTSINATDPESLHLTLKFLGDIQTDLLPEISSRLEKIASSCPSMELRLEKTGVFPDLFRPAVCWAGLNPLDEKALIELAGQIDLSLSEIGLSIEKRPFHPHVTLARIKRKPPESFFELFDEKVEFKWGQLICEELYLFQSEQIENRYVHTKIASFPLN